MSRLLYVKDLRDGKWHIARHQPTGYGVRALCGRAFEEGEYRTYGPGVVGGRFRCRRCGRVSR